MDRKTDIVGQDAFLVIFTAGSFPIQHVADFRKLTEFGEVAEMIHMTGIICVYFIEEQVAVCKSACMYRNDRNTFVEAFIAAQIVFEIRRTGNHDLTSLYALFIGIADGEMQRVEFCKTLFKPFCLIFIAQQLDI